MELQRDEIEKIVREVLNRLETKSVTHCRVVHPSVQEAVEAAKKSQKIFQELGLELRRKIIDAIRKAGVDHAERLAKLAHQETGMGRWEDKVKKNVLVSLKTPGIEDLQPAKAYTGDKGLTLVEYSPFGVVASVTPSTNPTSTILNNTISILSAGNSIVFAPHPKAKNCCQETMKILDDAICSAGGPPNLLNTFEPATEEKTLELLRSPDIDLTLVTGGPSIVKAALTSGAVRKTICAGPGNPPVIVDETAEISCAVNGIIEGASFDNCVLCTGEKEVILVEAIRENFLTEFRKDGRAYELTLEQMNALAKKVFQFSDSGKEPLLNKNLVGKNAEVLAREIGVTVPESVRLLWGEVPRDHSFIWIEQLMPVLPITSVMTIEEAIDLAKQVEGNNHHTASIYSMHIGNITKAARALACSIFVKNGSNFMGLGVGEGFATMSIGTPTGDGLTKPSHFSRPLHCSMVGHLRIV